MRPSECSLSDELNELLMLKEEIDNTILDREKLGLIQDASFQYNTLARMASPSYYTEMEEAVIRAIGREWNELIVAENGDASKSTDSQPNRHDMPIELKDIADELENFLNNLLDDNDSNNGTFTNNPNGEEE